MVTLITLIGWLWIPLGTGRGCQMLISLSGHPWSMWQSKYVVYLKLFMDLSCIPLQWTNTAKQFQRLMDKRFLGVQKVTSVFEKQTYGPILPWYCKQLLLLKTRQDQWQIQGRGPPPLIFRPNWGLKKILCETTPPYVRVLMTRPPPLSEGLDPPLRIQATTLDRLLQTSYMWWMSQTEKTSFQFPS